MNQKQVAVIATCFNQYLNYSGLNNMAHEKDSACGYVLDQKEKGSVNY